MAVYWLAVPFIVLGAYSLAYLYDFKLVTRPGLSGAAAIGLVVAAFFCVGFILTNNMTLMLEPSRWPEYFNHRNGTVFNPWRAEILMRYLHFMVSGLAVGGLFVALVGKYRLKAGSEVQALAIRAGMRTFALVTLAGVVLGLGI